MHNLDFIRTNPEEFDKALRARNLPPASDFVIKMDAERRILLKQIQTLQQQKNKLVKETGKLKNNTINLNLGSLDNLMQQAIAFSSEIEILNLKVKEIEDSLFRFLATLPNIPEFEIPIGIDENDNIEISRWGKIPVFNYLPQSHEVTAQNLKLMELEQTALISGARFVTLKGSLAKMERALINFMLDINTIEFGYQEISPPYLVKEKAMYGVGQLPKFYNESFKTDLDLRLIPTGEVPLTNLVADTILEEKCLPLRFTAYTPCFRLEAGSAGKDTKGIIRQHQFSKVELVSITKPEDSKQELERMTEVAETILKRLEIPFRRILLCTGDMGFSAKRTYDLEIWLPSQNRYREISSCSNCGDFQARRMKTKYKAQDGTNNFVHTLNGSALAVGRTIVGIIENYQNIDGSISIPLALQPYMHNMTKISQQNLNLVTS